MNEFNTFNNESYYMVDMRTELEELGIKMDTLNHYLHNDPSIHKVKHELVLLMQIQYQAMLTYRESLRSRMELMGMFK